MDKSMDKLKEMMCDELAEISKKPLDPRNLDMIEKLTESIKNIEKIKMMGEEESYGDYSSRGMYSRADGSYRMSRAADPYSYADDLEGKMRSMMNDRSISEEHRETIRKAMQLMR